jgi:Rod binding domain-containing protein
MDALRIETLGLPQGRNSDRAKAEKTAAQFETLFVRSMVSSLRSTSSLGGDGGGMFGSGPGSGTFGDWFDQNLAEQIARSSKVGIAQQLLVDLERHREIPESTEAKIKVAKAAADRAALTAIAARKGGIDVVLR